jgi:hypothetical protein
VRHLKEYFEGCISETDLKLAAQREEDYLKSQMLTKTVTIHEIPTIKEGARSA